MAKTSNGCLFSLFPRSRFSHLKTSIFIIALAVFSCPVPTLAGPYLIHQITDNEYDDTSPRINNRGHMTWQGSDGSDGEILFFDGTGIVALTDNELADSNPSINDTDEVAWKGWDGSDYEVFLHDGTTTTQITNDAYDEGAPRLNRNGQLAWTGNGHVFHFDGAQSRPLSDFPCTYTTDYSLSLNDGGQVAWTGCVPWLQDSYPIYFFDGTSVRRVTWPDLHGHDFCPRLSNLGTIAYLHDFDWLGFGVFVSTVPGALEWSDPSDLQINNSDRLVWNSFNREVHLYDGATITALSEEMFGTGHPRINEAGTVTWHANPNEPNGNYEIFVHDGTRRLQVTDNHYNDLCPEINDTGELAWQGWDGNDWEIFLAVPCQDGDGDGFCDVPTGGEDCDDSDPDVNPGEIEIPGNGIDDDCDPTTPSYPEPANTLAAAHGKSSLIGSGVCNELGLFVLPFVAILLLRRRPDRRSWK